METTVQKVTTDNFHALLRRLSDDELLMLYNTVAAFYDSRHHQHEEELEPIYSRRYIAEDGLPVWDLGLKETFNRWECYE